MLIASENWGPDPQLLAVIAGFFGVVALFNLFLAVVELRAAPRSSWRCWVGTAAGYLPVVAAAAAYCVCGAAVAIGGMVRIFTVY